MILILHRAARSAALLVLLPAAVGAQRPDSARFAPPTPTITRDQLAALVARAGVPAATNAPPRRQVFDIDRGPAVELAVGVAPSPTWLAAEDRRAGGVPSCLFGTTARTGEPLPWASYDSLTTGLPLLLVQVTPMPVTGGRCPADDDSAAPPPLVFSAEPDADSATLFVNHRPTSVPLAAHIGAHNSLGAAWNQLRLYLAPDVVDPAPDGRRPALALVLHRTGAAPAHLDVPPAWVHRLADARMLARAAALGATATVVRRPILPEPRDPVLRAAYLAAGERADTTVATVVARAAAAPLPADDAHFASLFVGDVLAQLGDSADARAQLRDALAIAPCLTLPAGSTSGARAMLDAVRPDVRCTVVSDRRLLLSGLLFPGGAESAVGRPWLGLAEAAVTIAFFGHALQLQRDASARHGAYLRSSDPSFAPVLLAEANDLRHSAHTTAIGGAVVWVGAATISWVSEHIHAHHIREARNYGALAASRPGVATPQKEAR